MAFDPSSDVCSPAIIVGNGDLRTLRALVERHAGGPASAIAAQLDATIQRAIVVPQAHLPPDVIGIGSRVALEEVDTALRREVVLAPPDEVGGASERLSVLSPLAVALLGAAAGETVAYETSSGASVEVRIRSVSRGGDAS